MNLLLIPCVLALRGLLGNAPQAIDVPVDVGVGPTANFFSGPVGADRLSRALAAPETNFLRPGAGLRAELTVALGKSLLVSGGWESQFYPPQALGAPVFSWGPLDQSIWHIGQAFVMLHGRFPHRTVL